MVRVYELEDVIGTHMYLSSGDVGADSIGSSVATPVALERLSFSRGVRMSSQNDPSANMKPGSRCAPPAQPNAHAATAIQAPWRLAYLESMGEKERLAGPPKAGSGSFLYDYWLAPESDVRNHVIVRNAHGMILLNAYPYANGHLLVALGDPRPTLLDYEPPQRSELWKLVEIATDLMQRMLQPQGINTGINQGRAAGAGVPQHLHVHLVPRWGGDANFMGVVAEVRVIPASLQAMAERYRRVWAGMQ